MLKLAYPRKNETNEKGNFVVVSCWNGIRTSRVLYLSFQLSLSNVTIKNVSIRSSQFKQYNYIIKIIIFKKVVMK